MVIKAALRSCGSLLVVLCLGAAGCRRPTPAPVATPAEETELHRQRTAFATKLLVHGPSPDTIGAFPVPDDARPALYPSGDRKLLAWTTPRHLDNRRRPAVVYLHGNFAFRPGNWEVTKPFRDADFVTFTPMLRGENGNAGEFECFYGEVDDVIAAGRYVASLPDVDPKRVYLCGHSVGGTLASLAAMMPSPYRAVSALSGAPDMETWFRSDGYEYRVYDPADERETRLRTPRFFVSSICRPLYLMDGDREWYYIPMTRQMAEDAAALGKRVTFENVPGDHRGFLPEAILRTVKLFQQDQ